VALYLYPSTLRDLGYVRRRCGLASLSAAIRRVFEVRGFAATRAPLVEADGERGRSVQLYLDAPTVARVRFYRQQHRVSLSAAVREAAAEMVARDTPVNSREG
jgi:hypothetical protein